MIYGNHDIVRRKQRYVNRTLHYFRKRIDEYFEKKYIKTTNGSLLELFKNFEVHKAIRLKYKPSDKILLLIHGHQADWFTNHYWWLARFFVRYVWKWLQNIGFKDPTSPAKNHSKAEKLDEKLEKCNIIVAQVEKAVKGGLKDNVAFISADFSKDWIADDANGLNKDGGPLYISIPGDFVINIGFMDDVDASKYKSKLGGMNNTPIETGLDIYGAFDGSVGYNNVEIRGGEVMQIDAK